MDIFILDNNKPWEGNTSHLPKDKTMYTHLPTLIKKQQQYIEDIKRIDTLLSSKKYNWTKENLKSLKLGKIRIERNLYKIECSLKNNQQTSHN